jgi:hypothetical protein
MPRYYFNVHDGKVMRDKLGSEFPDLDAARNEAITASAEMLRSLRDPMFWNGADWTMSVTDETGEELFSLPFSGQMKKAAA